MGRISLEKAGTGKSESVANKLGIAIAKVQKSNIAEEIKKRELRFIMLGVLFGGLLQPTQPGLIGGAVQEKFLGPQTE